MRDVNLSDTAWFFATVQQNNAITGSQFIPKKYSLKLFSFTNHIRYTISFTISFTILLFFYTITNLNNFATYRSISALLHLQGKFSYLVNYELLI